MWMHLFINLSPMGPLSHVSSSLQVGWVLRLGFAVVGWFRRFRLPPPPLVWFRFHRPPVGVCSSLFFCVPLFASWLSNLHLIFIVISLSLSFHHICPAVAGRVCVCAYHLYRCKTSLCRRCVLHSCPTTRNEAVDMSGKGNVAGFLYLRPYLYV